MLENEKDWGADLISLPRDQWTLGNLLAEKAKRNKGKTFLLFKDQAITFDEFESKANQAAHALTALGIKKGDKIGVLLANCPEYLFVWFAISKIGAVMVPFNIEWKGEILSYILTHSDTRGAIVQQDLMPQLKEALAGRDLDFYVVKSDGNAPVPDGTRDLKDFFMGPDTFTSPAIAPEDPFQIMYTSGTTGRSKGVLRSHEYVMLRALRALRVFGYTPEDIFYTALPMYHGNAQNLTTLPALFINGKMALGVRFSASQFWEDIRKHKATTFNYIGAMIAILYKAPPTNQDGKNHHVRFARGAGAPADLIPDFERRFNLEIVESYGTTEGGSINNRPGDRKIGSMGRPPYYNEAKVVDDDDNDLPAGNVGEMIIRPTDPTEIWVEYYKEPDATDEKMKDGWFRSGDLAMVDEDGFFFFKGRKKDAIRRRGENVSAQEVEMVIDRHPAVMESSVFGVPSELSEEDIMAAVVLKPGQALSPEQLIEYCQKNMARFMVPRYVEFLEELPKTPTFRTEKYKLVKRGVTATTWDREKITR
ncbi:MAG: ATP-dependent acyl-CoA ligase [Desulfobacteraceae bacterium]|nr:ATP-dependent acyl-CoA ligase [Desulfobacteraceae bacterium]